MATDTVIINEGDEIDGKAVDPAALAILAATLPSSPVMAGFITPVGTVDSAVVTGVSPSELITIEMTLDDDWAAQPGAICFLQLVADSWAESYMAGDPQVIIT